MTYIAKAMNKTTRLEVAADRGEGREPGAPDSNVVPVVPASSSPIEYIRTGEGDPAGSARGDDPRAAALAVTGLGRRSGAERNVSDYAALGTLETLPPEPAEASAPGTGRSWWREPIVIGGMGLGFAALLLGFLFTPGGPADGGAGESASPVVTGSTTSDAGEAKGGIDASATLAASGTAVSQVSGSGRNPVVVRVEIDGGQGGRVEFDSPEGSAPRQGFTPALAPMSEVPTMPAYFEPLPPLELPPPPVMDPSLAEDLEAPRPSRYEAPPVERSLDSIDDFQLEGIFWDESNPGAIINDTIVERGKRVGPLRVIDIQKNSVTVEFQGRTYELR